jgi:MbtH protein
MENAIDSGLCIVLINDEEQYSLWPMRRAIPSGWRAVGFEGSKEECVRYVDSAWTDMRPLSLRLEMARDIPSDSLS